MDNYGSLQTDCMYICLGSIFSTSKPLCCGLNVCVPPKFMLKPNAQCDAVRSGGWSPHEWDKCPYKRDPREILTPFHRVRLQQRRLSTNQGVGPHQTPHLPET